MYSASVDFRMPLITVSFHADFCGLILSFCCCIQNVYINNKMCPQNIMNIMAVKQHHWYFEEKSFEWFYDNSNQYCGTLL